MPLGPRTPLLRSPRVVVASGMHGTGVTTIAERMQLATTTLHIVDGGARWADILEACMPGFVRLIAVTTHDTVSISATYALITTVCDRFPSAHIEVLVNQSGAHEALKMYERIHDAASHFLGATIGYAGAIPGDCDVTPVHAGSRIAPPARASVGRSVVTAIQEVAARLDEELGWTASQTTPCTTDRRTIR